jgi:UV DNA damage endonuclease
MRLGFPVKVLGPPSLKSHDTRRWQNHPHLSVSLAYLRDIFLYLRRQDIRMYRMASDLAPYVSHPGLPEFHSQIQDCSAELAAVGEIAADYDLRLSFHLQLSTILNAHDEAIADQSARLATALARILEAMGQGPQAVVVTHVGGIYGDKDAALQRFAQRYERLPAPTRSRLALENDDGRFSVPDILWLHRQTGVPLVFDYLHFRNHNPEGLTAVEALSMCLRTWPTGVRPKIHFSSPRTAMRFIERKHAKSGPTSSLMRAPRPTQHADFVDPFQFLEFIGEAMRQIVPPFDVMLEAKAKDLALLHLREHLDRFAPDTLAYGNDGGNRRAPR